MSLANFSAIISSIGQLPVAALIVIACVLGGIGIGIGLIFRDIPKYTYKTIRDILSFILVLKGKKQADDPSDGNDGKESNHAARAFKIIKWGKTEKKTNYHENGQAT